MYILTYKEAIKITVGVMRASLDEATELGDTLNLDDLVGPRIYTRMSRHPELNANGGDYDYWTSFFYVRAGELRDYDTSDNLVWTNPVFGIYIRENWSCECANYCDFGGREYFVPNGLPGQLLTEARAQLAKELQK